MQKLEALRDTIDPYAAASKDLRRLRSTLRGNRSAKHRKLQLHEILGNESLEPETDVTPSKGRLLVLDVESRERNSGGATASGPKPPADRFAQPDRRMHRSVSRSPQRAS